MSKTYTKKPFCMNKYKGNFYKWKDLPREQKPVPVYKREQIDLDDEKWWHNPIFRRVLTGWKWQETLVDSALVTFYNTKTTHCDWYYRGSVGHENKKIRSRYHRARAKHVIKKKYLVEEDYDYGIPRERNHDRWDHW